MAYQVTVAGGTANVVLPDGLRHRPGDVVTLTDEQYAQLTASAVSSLLTVVNLNGLALAAATPSGGYALVNGTPNVITWTAPADGLEHRVSVAGQAHITSAATGGAVDVNFTMPDGTSSGYTWINGGQGAGYSYSQYDPSTIVVKPGSTVTVRQSSALTGGAVLLWAEIWAS